MLSDEQLKRQKSTELKKIKQLQERLAGLEKKNVELTHQLKNSQKQLQQEKARLPKAVREARQELETKKIKQLKDQLVSLKQKNNALLKANKEQDQGVKLVEKEDIKLKMRLSDTQGMLEQLQEKFKQLRRDYKELAVENKQLHKKIGDIPKKFTRLAQQNQKLIRQTGGMHYNLGVFYTQNKEYDRAAQEFLKAVEIKPDDASAHYNLGYIYGEHLKNRSPAIKHFKEYLRISKGLDEDADKARKYIMIWEAYGP